MTKELAIQILRGEVLGTNEQTHEAVFMAIKALKNEPKRGKWNHDKDGLVWCCLCGFGKERSEDRPYNFCPNCGAKMGGDIKDSE